MEKQRTADLDPAAIDQARQRAVLAELALAEARIDSEGQVQSLRTKGIDREFLLLDVERRKLELRIQADRIDEDAYERGMGLLAARESALREEAGRKRQELEAAFTIARLARQESAARDAGNQEEARRLQAARDRLEDAVTRREAMREARDLAMTGAERDQFAAQRVAEAQAARAQERAREERDRALGRDSERAGVGIGVAELQSRLLRSQGRTEEARARREEAMRRQDEVDRAEARRRFADQGFGAGEAARLADQQVKLAQAGRLLEQMGSQRQSIVADSLAAVGGGGGVSGVDPSLKVQERMERLLEQIADNTRESVDSDW
jgi:hypothetical protein